MRRAHELTPQRQIAGEDTGGNRVSPMRPIGGNHSGFLPHCGMGALFCSAAAGCLATATLCVSMRSDERGESARNPRRGGITMLTLYSMRRSGNCYKVRLALAQLKIPFHLTEINIL